jgi:integrase
MPPIPFPLFAERVRNLYARRRPKTARRVDQVLRTLQALRDGRGRPLVRTTADLTTDTACRFLAAQGPDANPNTLRGLLGSLSALCTYAVDEDWLDRAPKFKRLRPRKSPPIRPRHRPYAEVHRLLVHLRDRPGGWKARRDYALAATVALTGLRLGEALHLWIEDVALAGRVLRVVPRGGVPLKTESSARAVPLCAELATILRAWIPWAAPGPWLFPGVKRRGPWDGGNPADRALGRLQAAAREVGIDWISYHALRHSFATIALEHWGLPTWTVQKILGHTSLRTTENYLHLDEVAPLVEAVGALGFGLTDDDRGGRRVTA